MKRRWIALTSGMLLAGMMFSSPAIASKAADAKAKVEDATAVVEEMLASPDKGIPHDLVRKAAAVAIFPNVIKGGFIVGGEYGRGVILRHDIKRHRWSAPAFYSIAAGSIGWQIGAQSSDIILVIRSERGLKAMLKNEFKLGADASVAAGPVGRKAQAGTDASLKTEVFSYARSRGLFAGLSLEGAKLNVLSDYNRAYYGKAVTPREILLEAAVKAPKSAHKLIDVLQKLER